MNGSHSVDLGAVDRFIADMASFDATVESQVAALEAEVARLHLHWEGAAAQAQKAAHAELVAGIEEMRSALAALRAAARVAHGNYGSAVSANTRMFGQLG